MMAKELQDWFPEAQISDQPVEKEGYLTLPLASQQWILLEEAGLSEREKQLVALLTQQEQARSLNPWYSYLIRLKRLSMTLAFVCLSCWGRCGFRQALKPYQT